MFREGGQGKRGNDDREGERRGEKEAGINEVEREAENSILISLDRLIYIRKKEETKWGGKER